MPQDSYFCIDPNDITKTNEELIAEQNLILQKIFPDKNSEELRLKLSQILIDDFEEKNPIIVAKFLLEQINSDVIKRFSDESSFIEEYKFHYTQNQRLIQQDLKDYLIESDSTIPQSFREVAFESIQDLADDVKKNLIIAVGEVKQVSQHGSPSSSDLLKALALGLMPTLALGQDNSSLARSTTSLVNFSPPKFPKISGISSTPTPKSEYQKYVENLNGKISSIRQELSAKNPSELPEFSAIMTRLKSSNAELFDENGKLKANSNPIFGEFYEGLDLSKMKIKYEDFKFFNRNNVKFKDVNFSGSEIGNETPPASINIGVNIISGNLRNCVFKNFPRLAIGEDIFYKKIASTINADSGVKTIDEDGSIKISTVENHAFYEQQMKIFDALEIDVNNTKFLGNFYNANFASGDYKTANFDEASFLHCEDISYSKKIPFGARTQNADLSKTKFGSFAIQESDEEYRVTNSQITNVGASELALSDDMLDLTGSRYILQSKIDELSKNQPIYIRVNFGDAINDKQAQYFKNLFQISEAVDEKTKSELVDRVKAVIKHEFEKFNIIAIGEDDKIPDDAIVKNLAIYAQDGAGSASQFAEFLDDKSAIVFGLQQPNRGFVVSHEAGHALAGLDHPTQNSQSVMDYTDFLNKLGENGGLSSTPKYIFFGPKDKEVVEEIMRQVGRKMITTQDKEIIEYSDLKKIELRSTIYLGGSDNTKILKIKEAELQGSERISIMKASDVMLTCFKTQFPKDCLTDKTLEESSALVIYEPKNGISRENVKHIFIFDKGKNMVEIVDKNNTSNLFEIKSDNFSEQQQNIIFDQGKISQGYIKAQSSSPQTTSIPDKKIELKAPHIDGIESKRELNPPQIAGIVAGAVLSLLGLAYGVKKTIDSGRIASDVVDPENPSGRPSEPSSTQAMNNMERGNAR